MPNDFKVNVKVDATPGEDLIKVLEDMRQEYELLIKKKHQDFDVWYKEQVEERCPSFPKGPFLSGPQTDIPALCLVSQSAAMAQEAASPATGQSGQSDIHELKRTFQALEIDLETQYNKVILSQEAPGRVPHPRPLTSLWGPSPNSLGASLTSHFPSKLSMMKTVELSFTERARELIILNVINPHITPSR